MEVAAKCLFPQKLGPNPSEMEVRKFLSITKVIWNQARFLKVSFVNLYVMKATVNK